MLAQALEHYLAVRRAAGFKLKSTEQYLRYFVRFAHARGDAHVRGTTAIEWAAQAASGQGQRQPERSLPSELYDHPFGPFDLYDAQDVLECQRFEIQPVRRVVVC